MFVSVEATVYSDIHSVLPAKLLFAKFMNFLVAFYILVCYSMGASYSPWKQRLFSGDLTVAR